MSSHLPRVLVKKQGKGKNEFILERRVKIWERWRERHDFWGIELKLFPVGTNIEEKRSNIWAWFSRWEVWPNFQDNDINCFLPVQVLLYVSVQHKNRGTSTTQKLRWVRTAQKSRKGFLGTEIETTVHHKNISIYYRPYSSFCTVRNMEIFLRQPLVNFLSWVFTVRHRKRDINFSSGLR